MNKLMRQVTCFYFRIDIMKTNKVHRDIRQIPAGKELSWQNQEEEAV